jgi:hypothetical protein
MRVFRADLGILCDCFLYCDAAALAPARCVPETVENFKTVL